MAWLRGGSENAEHMDLVSSGPRRAHFSLQMNKSAFRLPNLFSNISLKSGSSLQVGSARRSLVGRPPSLEGGQVITVCLSRTPAEISPEGLTSPEHPLCRQSQDGLLGTFWVWKLPSLPGTAGMVDGPGAMCGGKFNSTIQLNQGASGTTYTCRNQIPEFTDERSLSCQTPTSSPYPVTE